MADGLGACLAGCGRAGLVHARGCNGRVRGARLVALCDPFEGSLAAAQEELGVANTYTYMAYREAIVDAALDATSVETVTDPRSRRGRFRMRAHRRPGALAPRDVVA
ncbi:Gfo/Idh/MocA family oxidoreductase [Olsenella massiliensis]|uniref:hypothetical protein n=1 Tax=Olsenella massiliensis TaxID=1622075 RepID=UPI00071E099C|nr:hypothetical protein [Olsenella massiliensis]